MQHIEENIAHASRDDELSIDCDVLEDIDYWSIDEFVDVLPAYALMVRERL